jgi:hypothetical protein
MVRNCREHLHDTGRGFATDNLYFDDDAILAGLNDAKRRVVKALLLRPGPNPRVPNPAYVTLCRLQKTCDGTTNTPTPDDFWRLEGGLAADSTYIPRVSLAIGEAMVGTGHDGIFVKGGIFFGTATTALYWAYPVEKITMSKAILTEFPDGLYDAIELLAVRDLLAQEQSDNADRWKYYGEVFMESLQTFD